MDRLDRPTEPTPIQFGPFRLNGPHGPLSRDGSDIALRGMSMKLLWFLATQPDQAVSKQAIFAAIWPDRVVSEGSLSVIIREIRDVLDDSARSPRYIQTIHGHGYRFIGLRPTMPLAADQVLVGRQAQLDTLRESCAGIASGGARWVLVGAAAGSGKTALLDSWLTRVYSDNPGALVMRGCCIDKAATLEPYQPIVHALRELGRGPDGQLLTAAMRRVAPGWLLQFPDFIDDAEHEILLQRMVSVVASRMRRELLELLELLSRDRGLVLALDDMHWCDTASAEALTWLIAESRRLRVQFVLAFRETDVRRHGHALAPVIERVRMQGNGIELQLEPLSREQVACYMRRRLGDVDVEPLIDEVLARSEGRPLFMRALTDAIAAATDAGSEISPMSLPQDLISHVELRLSDLTADECQLLEVASITNEAFGTEDLALALKRRTNASVDRLCESLARRGEFIEEREPCVLPNGSVSIQFGFRHSLYPEIIRRRLTAARAVQYHADIAVAIESAWANEHRTVTARLAYHFCQAGVVDKAARYLKAAAALASQRYAHREAAKLLRQGLALVQQIEQAEVKDALELDLLLALGPVLVVLHGYGAEEVETTFARAAALCENEALAAFRFPVLRGLAAFYAVRAEYAKADALGRQLQAIDVPHDAHGNGASLEGHMVCGIAASFRGEFDAARRSLGHTIELYNPALHGSHAHLHGVEPGALALAYDALVAWIGADAATAKLHAEQALARAQASEHPFTIAQVHALIALLHQLRRDLNKTGCHSDAAAQLASRHGYQYLVASEQIRTAWIDAALSGSGRSIDALKKGMDLYLQTGALGGLSVLYGTLAEALVVAAQPGDAIAVVDKALAVCETNREHMVQAELLRLRAGLYRRDDEQSAKTALQTLAQAHALAVRQGARAFQIRIVVDAMALAGPQLHEHGFGADCKPPTAEEIAEYARRVR